MTRESACCVWDLTIKEDIIGKDDLITIFKERCKKWAFQLEEADTGYKHYQCRISLKTKLRQHQVLEWLEELGPGWGRLSRTSGRVAETGNNFYVLKSETRIGGPWRDTDMEVPWQYKDEPEWYPWQQEVINIMEHRPSKRRIHVIVDRQGRSGKSYLACWHACRGLARMVPPLADYKDIMRLMCDVPNTNCIFIDIPRALDKKQLRGFFGAMETIKSGYAFDERYHMKEKWFGTPHVFIFTNKYPDLNLLTMDRWVIHDMDVETKVMNRVCWNELIAKSNEDNGIWE